MATDRRSFGRLRKRPSGRWQAAYVGKDNQVHNAPSTFQRKDDAVGWLASERALMESPHWRSPADRAAAALAAVPPTLAEYSTDWLAARNLKPRTVDHYEDLLRRKILPPFATKAGQQLALGALRMDAITPTTVKLWYVTMGKKTPTQLSHSYALLSTIMKTAAAEKVIPTNPCVLEGAGKKRRRKHKPVPATFEELDIIVDHMPPYLQLAVLIAAWCGLRFGEVFELRRSDIILGKRPAIKVYHSVSWPRGEKVRRPDRGAYAVPHVGETKTEAGDRTVSIPPHLVPYFERHLDAFAQPGPDGLMFIGQRSGVQVRSTTVYRSYGPARRAAGRPDLRWHDLRHTGATLAGATGATLAELMNRLGHNTVEAAMMYQHATEERDQVIGALMSKMVQPIPIDRKKRTA